MFYIFHVAIGFILVLFHNEKTSQFRNCLWSTWIVITARILVIWISYLIFVVEKRIKNWKFNVSGFEKLDGRLEKCTRDGVPGGFLCVLIVRPELHWIVVVSPYTSNPTYPFRILPTHPFYPSQLLSPPIYHVRVNGHGSSTLSRADDVRFIGH